MLELNLPLKKLSIRVSAIMLRSTLSSSSSSPKEMIEAGLITQDEYDKTKAAILAKM
jgi:hypothetical protein